LSPFKYLRCETEPAIGLEKEMGDEGGRHPIHSFQFYCYSPLLWPGYSGNWLRWRNLLQLLFTGLAGESNLWPIQEILQSIKIVLILILKKILKNIKTIFLSFFINYFLIISFLFNLSILVLLKFQNRCVLLN